MKTDSRQIQLALISHTNVGKTTLARTLSGVDVGEVRDAPHVTTLAQASVLLQSPQGDVLQLWDTPGFGDSARLFKRLAMAGNPLGWFLREVIDRYRDWPFWLSQQAIRAARDAADVVLYLVNASEDPKDTGYLDPELKILHWLGKPVLVLLNQVGAPRPFVEEEAEQARWRQHLAHHPCIRGILSLDAFSRCWVHERVFYATVADLIPAEKKDAYHRLVSTWEQDHETRFEAAMNLLAKQVVGAARDSEAIERDQGAVVGTVLSAVGLGRRREQMLQNKAMAALMLRLNASTQSTTAGLLELYRLDPGEAARISDAVNDAFVVREPIDQVQAGLLGAIITGAATGLKADLISGGLTHGAGAIFGGIVGAITFASAAWGFNASTARDQPEMRFSDEFLRSLVVAGLLRYLAVTHFGRGRGKFLDDDGPGFWQDAVESALDLDALEAASVLRKVRSRSTTQGAVAALGATLKQVSMRIFETLYPGHCRIDLPGVAAAPARGPDR